MSSNVARVNVIELLQWWITRINVCQLKIETKNLKRQKKFPDNPLIGNVFF
jgi:hypothetical protein